MNIVYGGAFDPLTKAHKMIIDKIKKIFKPVNFIITLTNDKTYYKNTSASYNDRLNMLKLVFKDSLIYDNYESDKYYGTYEYLVNLSKKYSDIYFLLGADQFKKLPSWIKYDDLISNFHFIVLNRNNILNDELINSVTKDNRTNFIFVDLNIDISSTMFKENKNNKKILDKKVYKYIIKYNLYGVNDV